MIYDTCNKTHNIKTNKYKKLHKYEWIKNKFIHYKVYTRYTSRLYLETSEPKWVNPNGVQYGVNSLSLGGLYLWISKMWKVGGKIKFNYMIIISESDAIGKVY